MLFMQFQLVISKAMEGLQVLKTVGKRVKKYDVYGHVSGKTIYVDDIKYPGMQYIKTLRSPYHKATIKSIDVTEAENMLGVTAVLTAKDVPNNIYGYYADEPVFADKDIRWRGQVIAAVVAVDEDTALEAIEKIKMDIVEEQCIQDPEEAMKEGAVQVRPEGNFYEYEKNQYLRKMRIGGDVDEVFKDCDHIVESRFVSVPNEHAALETQVSVSTIDNHGRLIVHTVCQGKQVHLGFISSILNLPMNQINMIGGTVGGGFGGKHKNHADIVTSLATWITKKPVKWRWTREEEMLYSSWRGAWIAEMKDGVNNDGKIMARKIKVIHDCGAYSELGPYAVDKAALTISGPYAIPNIYVDAYCIYTNKTPSCAMRGFGINCGLTGEEIHTEKVARAIGMDSFEFRFKNAWREGDVSISRQKLKSVSTIEVMQDVARISNTELSEELQAMSSKMGDKK
jgi:CO/xanthine dehydrogenase Mo-binding subunit